ncbi:putative fad binding domain-containing protein [Phaeoacremonium minimum UCRPA7]|uniref:Putative fad binding domain-containing protein n=1 Tax=Phaeoacremonium minimum (strain UCR-PA7) TaxID=1286976 RepID=R8BBQ8_PHAM7|nr:putative fad binding domain-containing protein [Phaeoacremonium minimum UCRPA7]EON96736.1 putative fad binding domain-containing protein [Phaeoacremonium minimum UCRPA7]
MPIDNAANIGPEGILMAMTNLSTLAISDDRQTVVVGSGITWPPLYAYLDKYGVTANGIRSGDGGVIGAILGGGPFGFMAYEFGMSNAAKSLDCVLADGSLVTASAEEHPDLFWALVGGGNNFCIVTQAVLNTIPISSALIGTVSWGANVSEKYIKGVEQFALHGAEYPKASFEGQTRWVPSRSSDISFDGYLWYSGEGDVPVGLENFTAPILPITRGNITRTTMGAWTNEFNYAPLLGTRASFHWLTSKANATAARIAFDTYYESVASLADVEGFSTAFNMLPITPIVTAAPENAMGLGRDDSPAIWYVEAPLWSNPEDDERVLGVHAVANAKIREKLAAVGLGPLQFMYLSDIQKSQIPETYPAYGAKNLRKLKAIRDKYDPDLVFTELVPGGAKVALA